MKKILKRTADELLKFLGSTLLTWITIALFFFQALWVAFSYRYPMLFDEAYHTGVIDFFSKRISPIVLSQDSNYDSLGSLAFGNASLYHYFLSIPNRVLEYFTDDFEIKIIFLRVINIMLASVGLYLFSILFKKLGLRKRYTNLTLIIFSLIPLVTLVAATVNYDNAIFAITPLFLISGVNILNTKRIEFKKWAIFIIVGCLGSLIKFSFLPLFVAGLIFLSYFEYRLSGKDTIKRLVSSAKRMTKVSKYIIGVSLVVIVFFFTYRYIASTVLYRSPIPRCEVVLNKERCAKNPVIAIEENALVTKDTRDVVLLNEYVQDWLDLMVQYYGVTAANSSENKIDGANSPAIVNNIINFGFLIGAVLIIYYWKQLRDNNKWRFILKTSLFLVFSTFLFNMISYYQFRSHINLQPRYLLSVFPIFIIFSMLATSWAIGRRTYLKLTLALIVLLALTQGGGLGTHILYSKNTWYWNNQKVIDANAKAKQLLDPFIKQQWPF